MQISRIRLSDKTSRLRPRHVVPKPGSRPRAECWPVADTGLAGPRRIHPPERVAQEVKPALRHFAGTLQMLTVNFSLPMISQRAAIAASRVETVLRLVFGSSIDQVFACRSLREREQRLSAIDRR
jgi:hypothetical protein